MRALSQKKRFVSIRNMKNKVQYSGRYNVELATVTVKEDLNNPELEEKIYVKDYEDSGLKVCG